MIERRARYELDLVIAPAACLRTRYLGLDASFSLTQRNSFQ
jgi:hypothetical protein